MIKQPGSETAFFDSPWDGKHTTAAGEGFFNGGFQTNEMMVDPLVTGYAFIFWTKVPKWVTDQYDGFKQFTQKNFRSLGGIANIEISGISVQAGFTGNETLVAGTVTKGQGFTLKHKEFSGSPVRNAYTHWVTGIRDPETGIARYPREYGLEYSARNHTGELLYVQTRPDADNKDGKIVEYAQYFTNVFPLVVPRDHHNFEAGSSDQVELEITFAGKPHQSAAVDNFAAKKLKESTYKFVTEGEFSAKVMG